MRRVGDAEWRWFGSQKDAGKAFGVPSTDVSKLVNNPSKTREHVRERFEARSARAPSQQKRERPTKKVGGAPSKKKLRVENAYLKSNGKWANAAIFPGREFDSLDEYRAAKKQREERRADWRAHGT